MNSQPILDDLIVQFECEEPCIFSFVSVLFDKRRKRSRKNCFFKFFGSTTGRTWKGERGNTLNISIKNMSNLAYLERFGNRCAQYFRQNVANVINRKL